MMEEELRLEPMTEERYHGFFRGYQNDPALYLHPEEYREYRYAPERSKHISGGRGNAGGSRWR